MKLDVYEVSFQEYEGDVTYGERLHSTRRWVDQRDFALVPEQWAHRGELGVGAAVRRACKPDHDSFPESPVEPA